MRLSLLCISALCALSLGACADDGSPNQKAGLSRHCIALSASNAEPDIPDAVLPVVTELSGAAITLKHVNIGLAGCTDLTLSGKASGRGGPVTDYALAPFRCGSGPDAFAGEGVATYGAGETGIEVDVSNATGTSVVCSFVTLTR
jgi:hypothetical protein